MKVWLLLFGLVGLLLGVGCATVTPPAFSREQAIERAKEAAMQSRPEVEIHDAQISDITAELMTLSQAEQRIGQDSSIRSANPQVWFVTLKGKFVYEDSHCRKCIKFIKGIPSSL